MTGLEARPQCPDSSHQAISAEIEALRREVEGLQILGSKEGQALLEAFLQHSPHGIIACDASGRLTLLNAAAERIWAGSAESVPDWSKIRAFDSDGRPHADDWSMARCLRERDVVPAEEMWIQRFDGTRALLLGSCAPMFAPTGEICGALSVFADITESRRLAAVERSVPEQGERLQRITTALVRAVTQKDVADIVLQVVRDALGAEVAALSLVSTDGDALETHAWAGELAPELMAKFRWVPLSARIAATDAVRARKAVFIESLEDHEARYPNVAAGSPYTGGARGAVPLTAGDRVIGTINLGFPTWRRLSEAELLFMTAVADQCALALERSRLFEAERAARGEAEASQHETRLLFELSEAVNRAETLDEIYETALNVVIDGLRVDRASVLLFDSDGVMRFKAARGLSDAYRKEVEGHSPWPADEHEPRPLLVPDVLADDAWAPYRDLFRKEGIGALGFIPLVHRRRLLGKFMIYCQGPKHFTQREVELAQTIATQIAQAVARSHLLAAERSARADAERAAERIRRLQRVTASLSEAATPAQVAEVVVAQGVAATGASTGGLWLREANDTAELVHAEGYSEQGQKNFSRIELGGPLSMPVIDVFRTNDGVWIQSGQEFASRYPQLAALAGSRAAYRMASVPIRAAGRCIAALAFTFDVAGEFDLEESEFLLNVAQQGGLALERSELLAAERKARAEADAAHRRASFKAEASAALASSLDYETTLKNVAKLAVPKFADWCAVDLLDAEGRSTLVAVEHVDPAKVQLAWTLRERYPTDPQAPQGAPQVLRSGKPELYTEIPDEVLEQGCRDAEHLSLARSLGLKSAINAPISVQGRTIGVITFIWAESTQRYDEADLETAVLLGQRAALAIENSKLHRNLQRAVRARDDLLAVVSHDLRNPLGVVSMKADAIRRSLLDQPAWAKPRAHAEGIQLAAQRMEDLINDLLDLGSIESSALKIELAPEDLGSLLSTALEELHPLAGSKAIHIDAEPPAQSVRVRCDRRRILQVFSNLVGNAIKFTPRHGCVVIRALLEDDTAKIMVSDTGRGINPEHLSQIFERYYQAPTQEKGGVGLGLFIAKGIVTAHGGRIWAESMPGAGSKFYFTLPRCDRGAA